MRPTLAIAGRELRSYFFTPSGYIIISLFLLLTGGMFVFSGFRSGDIASMRPVFSVGTWLLAFIGPAITMRLLSEEFRLGTIESLMTSPVRETQVVLGKFFGAMGLLGLMLVPTVMYVFALEAYGRPDYGELFCGYLGLLVAGAAYVASGVLASSLTSSQPVAFLVALFFWMTLGLAAKLLPAHVSDPWAGWIFAIDPELRLRDFTIGLIDTSNVVFFLSASAVFLFAAVQVLAARRWRT
jgi:ABC-2 type transport system permease protein